jgi:hypothetical protein
MSKDPLDEAKRIMGALVRQPPKPHAEMKLGKPRRKNAKNPPKGKPPHSSKSSRG